jgi:hypothetical protein
MNNEEQAARFELLRASTAKLLGYTDAESLTAAQQIRVDRAIALRLLVDSGQAAQLGGEPVDVRELVSASEALERLVGNNLETPASARFGPSARERLRRLIEQTVLASDQVDPAAEAERAWRDEMACIAGAAADPASVAPPPPAPAPAALPAPPPPVEPPAAEHPLRTHSMNNPTAEPLPRKPTEQSPTYSAFAEWTARQHNGLRRNWSPPEGW